MFGGVLMINNLLQTLDEVKPNGQGKWNARCPAHEDRSPSLAIKLADNNLILLHCFAGCPVADIVSAVGLELSDLMPENPTYQKGIKPPKFNKYELFDRVVFEAVILSMGIRQLLNGKVIEQQDLLRITQAENTINDMAREVRS